MIGESFYAFRVRLFSFTSIAVGIAMTTWPTIGYPDELAIASGRGASSAVPLSADAAADYERVRQRVQNALHDDRYFYDAHVTVSMDDGNVALRGFVMSEWDLRKGLQIAQRAASGRRVINYLSINLGGAR